MQGEIPTRNKPVLALPEIGCDPARKGKNYTAILVRSGPHALHFEQHNGWEAPKTVGRLKELAHEWAAWATARRDAHDAPILARQIKVKVDSDGLGAGAIIDWANPGWEQSFTFVPVSAATPPVDATRYLNKRSELWFDTAQRAKMGRLDLSRLPKKTLAILRQQALAPQWEMDGLGHRVVERKEHLEKRGVPSPDALDALNLAYYEGAAQSLAVETFPALSDRPRLNDDEITNEAERDNRDRHDRPAHHRGRRL